MQHSPQLVLGDLEPLKHGQTSETIPACYLQHDLGDPLTVPLLLLAMGWSRTSCGLEAIMMLLLVVLLLAGGTGHSPLHPLHAGAAFLATQPLRKEPSGHSVMF